MHLEAGVKHLEVVGQKLLAHDLFFTGLAADHIPLWCHDNTSAVTERRRLGEARRSCSSIPSIHTTFGASSVDRLSLTVVRTHAATRVFERSDYSFGRKVISSS